MNSTKINDWLQVIGLFGVIASLLFVGLQIKQDQEIALSVASQARTELNVQYLLGSAANSVLGSGDVKVGSGNADQLTMAERRAMTLHSTALLFVYENIHYQHENGFIPEGRWQGTLNSLKNSMIIVPNLREHYERTPEQLSESFQAVVDGVLAEIDAES